MSIAQSLRRFAFVSLVFVAVACGRDSVVEMQVLPAPTTQDRIWSNGGFDQDPNGTMPPTGWVVTNYENLGVSGSPTTPPTSFAALDLQNQGTMVNETVVLTGTIGTLSDPDLGTSVSFRYPLYGVGTAVVNWLSNATNGNNRNVNSMSQTMTVAAADVDTTDNQVHVRFAAAPVMENPTHSYTDQPYYYIELDNLTTGTTLYTNFNLSGSQGVNWNSAISQVTGNSTLWTNWQLVDIVPGNANLRVGDQVQLSVVAAGCALSGHFGRVYIDGVGSFVPGPYTYANGPEYANANSTITYTFNYANGGGNMAYGTQVSFTTPPNTTFQSVSLGSTQCSTPAVGSSGTVICPVGTLQPGAGGSFTASVNINSNATGTITNGLYYIQSVGQTALYGNKITTQLTASTQALADANMTFGTTVPVANWGQNISYSFKVDNNGPSNLTTGAVVVAHNIPSQLTNATWSCAVTAGSGPSTTCATSNGSGNISVRPRIASGGELTYTVNANVVAGTGTSTVNVTASASVVSGVVDPETSNNQASFAITLGTPAVSLALTKTGSTSSGTVASYPTGISCGTTCSSQTTQFVSGTSVEFQATPVVGATFVGWSGACTGNSPRCAVALNSNQTLTANFSAPPPVGPAANVYVYSGGSQYALAGNVFLSPMTAIVLDANGMAVNNATVTFTAPTSGATAIMNPNVVTTNAWGLASVSPKANATSGTYSVKAQVAGAAAATFTMYNTGVAKKIIYVGGGVSNTYPQTAAVNTGFVSPLVAQVLDLSNYPIPGQTVTYAPPGSGASASLSATTVQTDAGGFATVYATANATSGGPYKVNATVSGVGTAAPFYLQNTTSTASAIYVVSGTPQLTPATSTFSQYLVASVVDSSGNAIQGVSVTFSVPSSGATATLSPSNTVTTNAAGEALVLATANATPGTYTVSASVSGVSTNANFTLTNDGTQYVSVQSGSPQSTAYSSVFPQPLEVLVLDNNGNPVQNTNVTFTAPSSGASATLGGSLTKVVKTDVNGNANVTATANATLGSYSVSAAVAAAANPATFALTNAAGGAANCNITSGNNQSARVGTAFTNVLSVKVTDGAGHAVSGVTVTFNPPASGASTTLSSLMVTTDANGSATVSAEAGTVAGTYALGVTVGTVTNSFTLTNTAANANAVVVTSGNNQTPTAHGTFPAPLVASVVDAYGNGVSGVAVTFTVVTGSGGANATPTTHAGTSGTSGTVTFTPTAANNVAGAYTVTANSAGLVGTTFSVTNVAAAPANLVVSSGNNQTATVNTAFTLPLVVTATDTYGNPIIGGTATFTAPAGGATAFLSSGTTTTNPNGQASITANANVTSGTYTVNATLGGLTAPFTLINSAATAVAGSVASGGTQSPVVNANFTSPLQVLVVDTYGNPVPGVLVTFAAPGSGASALLSSLTATTGSNGVASVTAKANTTAGSYVITATVAGVSGVISFNVTNVAAAGASIAVVSGNNQSATVHTGFGVALVAVVKDTYGNLVPSASVTFTGPGSGASATIVGSPATTGSNGQASATITANTVSGAYSVTAATGGVSTTFSLTNTAAAAASISLVSGNNQTPIVHGAFGAALVVSVQDTYNNPVPSAQVTFTAPGSGASATLPSGGLATTGSNGQASLTPTANTLTGAYTISAAAAGSSVSFSATNKAAAVASLTIKGGNNQTPTVHGAFGTALTVQAQDTYGNDVPNASVTFAAPGSGATAAFTGNPATADANGNASVTATAGTVAGAYTISATSNGVSTTFNVTNQASTPASIAVVSGNNQSPTVNAAFGAALVVSVQDTYNNPVPNAQVTFTAPGSGASATLPSGGLATTASNGQASITPTANTVAGAYTLTATVGGASGSAGFAATNMSAGVATLTVTGGNNQTPTVAGAFSTALTVQARDTYNNVVPSASVTFTVPSSNASATLTGNPASTDVNGNASVTAVANNTAGAYSITVTSGSGTATISVTNQAAAPASITVVSGNNQTPTVNGSFSSALVVLVQDTYTNPVPSAQVTFTTPTSGASATVTGSPATTGSNGQASVTATANSVAGTYILVASVGGASSNANFAVTNQAGAPATISVVSGSNQSVTIQQSFAAPLTALVVDANNNPVPNVTVTFSAPSSGASATFAGNANVSTSSTGKASVSVQANSVSGPYAVTASVAGVSTPASFLLNNTAGGATAVTIVSGSGQTTAVGTAFTNPLVAQVLDSANNPVPGARLTFAAPIHGPSVALSATGGVTNSLGQVSVNANALTQTGNIIVTVTLSGAPSASFILQAVAGPVAVLIPDPGATTMAAMVGTSFIAPLGITAYDAWHNLATGAALQYALPATGASATLDNHVVTTDPNGHASAIATANMTLGGYIVLVSPQGLRTPSAAFTLWNLSTPPRKITVTSGSPASATVNTPFGTAWGVQLVDSNNVPVPNVTVVYTAPRTGATAALSSPTQQTSSMGMAQITATAGRVAGSYVVTAYGTNAAQPALFYATNVQSAPASVVANLLSSPQNAQVGTSFKYPLGVIVYDALNNPITNTTVTFTAPSTGATALLGNVTVATDNTGFASVTAAANSNVGTYQVTATVNGVATPAIFNLGNLLNPPVAVFAAGGDGQSAPVGTMFASPLAVALEDSSGNPVANTNVTFAAPTSGATAVFTPGPIPSDANGNVQLAVTAGSVVGSYPVVAVADSGDAPVLYNLTNLQGTSTSLSVVASASPQYTAVDQSFANPLWVTVLDALNNPVPDATVTYSVSISGGNATATLSDTQAVTGPDGVASVTAIANGEVGSYTVTASVAGVAQGANFVLNNIAGPATMVTLSSGGSQSAPGLTMYSTPVVFQVLDGLGFPVPNTTVQIVAQPSILTGVPSTAQTDSSGKVTLNLTAGSTVGTVTISVSTFGVPSPASATLYVTQIPTTTTLSHLPRMGEGDALTLSAQIAATAGALTGQVDFSIDGKVLGTSSLDGNGMATTTFTAPTVGSHNVMASYRGTVLFAASTSAGSSGSSMQDWTPGGEGCAATGGSAWLFFAAVALAAWRSVGRVGSGSGRWFGRDAWTRGRWFVRP